MKGDGIVLENTLRRIRKELGLKQIELADILGVPQQSLSRAERSAVISDYYRQLIQDAVQRHFPEKEEQVLAILDGADALKEAAFALESQQETPKDFPEGDAWNFALQFRNALMLDRLACHGSAIGLAASRKADGILFSGRKVVNKERSLNELLYPCPQRVGLEPGMVVLLGDPQRHTAAAEVFQVLIGYLRSNRREVSISIFPDRPFYFGYHTCLKYLRVKKTIYRPCRYVDDDGLAVCYEDYGVIFSAGLKLLVKGLNPFGEQASHLVLVSGLHRLATGAGVKLLEDLDFRESVLKGTEFDFPSGERLGVLAYQVVVRSDNRLWSKDPGFKWSNSRVKELRVLADWNESIHNLRSPKL